MAVADFLSRNGGGGRRPEGSPAWVGRWGYVARGAWFSGLCSGREHWETSGEKVGQVQMMITCVWLQWLAGRDRLRDAGELHRLRERRRLVCVTAGWRESWKTLNLEKLYVYWTVPLWQPLFLCFLYNKVIRVSERHPCPLPSTLWNWAVLQRLLRYNHCKAALQEIKFLQYIYILQKLNIFNLWQNLVILYVVWGVGIISS